MTRTLFGGLTTLDLAYLTDELPSPGGKGTARDSYLDIGGPAANAAITAQDLGSDSVLHTVVGHTLFGAHVETMLSSYGVQLVDHGPTSTPPVASIWVDGSGDRTILSTDNRGAEIEVPTALIDVSDRDVLLLDGHYPELQFALATAAVEAGAPVVLDCGRWREVYSELFPMASAVIMTDTFRPPNLVGSSTVETIQELSDRYSLELVAATRGPEPVVAVTATHTHEVPVPTVDVVDTTGAGDVFHGAYLHYRYGTGLDAVASLEAASGLASESCTRAGR